MIGPVEWIVSSSLLILVVMALRVLFAEKISLRLRYALWLVVAARLLVPLSFNVEVYGARLPVGAADLAPELPQLSQRPLSPDLALVRSDVPLENAERSGYEILEDGTVRATRTDAAAYTYPVLSDDGTSIWVYQGGFTVEDAVWAGFDLVWKLGAAGVGAAFLWSNLRFGLGLRRNRRLRKEEAPIPVYVADGLPSPCLFGLFPPAVYLTPRSAEDEGVRKHVLAHELTHYAHRDPIWAVVRCLCLALHWYNPLVWLAVVLSKRDSELACDEGAVARLGEDQRFAYGRTLVGMVAGGRVRNGLLSCSTTMTEGKKSIQQRVALLVKHPQTVKTALFVAVSLLTLAVVFTFAEKQEPGGELTADELAYFNETYFNGESANIRNQFLTSLYDSPEDIDLYQLFYLGDCQPSMEGYSDQERAAVIAATGEPDCPLTRTTRAEMDRVLMEYTGLSLEQTNRVGMEGFTYLPEYNAYYHWHGDTNYYPDVQFLSGTRSGDIISLCYQDSFAGRGKCVLTLREMGEGSYHFLSHTAESSYYEIDDPKYIAAMSQLLLGDPETVARNESPDYDMADWLTNWTNLYVIQYGVPWWDQNAPEGWWARAIDAGSWYAVQIPDHMVEPVLALCQEAEAEENAKANAEAEAAAAFQTYLRELEDEDIRAITSEAREIDLNQLTRLIRSAAEDGIEVPQDSGDFFRYDLWEIDFQTEDAGWLYLTAGTRENVVCIRSAEKGAVYCASEKLYQFIRTAHTAPADAIDREALTGTLQGVMDLVLARELEKWNGIYESNGMEARYTDATLTGFRPLASYPDLVKEGEVNLYTYDYGLTIGDLSQAAWVGGNYADGRGLFHPYSHALHLLTVKWEGGEMLSHTFQYEFVLEEGRGADIVDEAYVKDHVVNELRELLDPVVLPDSAETPEEAVEAYGEALAGYYRSLGGGHPGAVTFAQLAGVEIYQRTEDAVCAHITLAVDPVEPNSVYWMAGAGIDRQADGHWYQTLEYCLERNPDNTWDCTQWGSGGVTLPELR